VPTLNDLILSVTGGPSVNEGLFAYFGGTATTLQDRERAWLEGKTAVRGPIEDMWFDYLYNVRGYSGDRNDMEYRFWKDGGAVAPPTVLTKDFTAVWGQISISSVGYRLSPLVGSMVPDNTFAGGSIAQLAARDDDLVYVQPVGNVQFPDIKPGFIWLTLDAGSGGQSIAMQWDTIDRYVALVDGVYEQAVSNIGLPRRIRLSGDLP
jgi:hypothetical protein